MIATQPASSAPARWRKSSFSTAGNDCVEVGQTRSGCAVRDSKDPGAGHLAFSAATWAAFLADVKRRHPGRRPD